MDWQLRDHLDDGWRAYGRAALELRKTMRESGAGAMSHSGDDAFVENAAKKLSAAYKRYQQAFNALTGVRCRPQEQKSSLSDLLHEVIVGLVNSR
jgi:hypothetical protein